MTSFFSNITNLMLKPTDMNVNNVKQAPLMTDASTNINQKHRSERLFIISYYMQL